MKTIIITLLLAMALVINSCSKDDKNSLTAPTTDGSGTLSFLLDGKVWRPKTSFNFPITKPSHSLSMLPIEYDSISGNKVNDLIGIGISAYNEDTYYIFFLKIDSILTEGKYKIKEVLFNKGFDQSYNRFDTLSNSNFVNITKIHRDYKPPFVDVNNALYPGYYSEESYISGTFEMTLKNRFGDSVVITNGRFDLKAREYYE